MRSITLEIGDVGNHITPHLHTSGPPNGTQNGPQMGPQKGPKQDPKKFHGIRSYDLGHCQLIKAKPFFIQEFVRNLKGTFYPRGEGGKILALEFSGIAAEFAIVANEIAFCRKRIL